MKELLKAYNDYHYREYEHGPLTMEEFKKEIENENGIIYIAYTEDETGAPMQTAYDFKTQEYITLYNEEEKERKKVSLKWFIHDLKYASFDDFIRDCWQYAQED